MIYTAFTKKALRISFNAHKNQLDKSGMPYVYHPFHVAEQMKDEYSTCVALLHDVVEDTDMTFDDLRNEGIDEAVIEALELLTHSPDVPYMDYVAKIKGHPVAEAVKLADLRHNSDLSRFDNVTETILQKNQKYLDAIKYLTE